MGVYLYLQMITRWNEDDGYIDRSIAESCWSSDVRYNRKSLAKLCSPEVGLLEATESGYVVKKYSDFNETKSDIHDRRSSSAERVRKHRSERSVTGYNSVTPPHCNAFVSVNVNDLKDSDPDPVNSKPDASEKLTSEQRYLRAYESGISKATGQPFVVAHWDGSLGLLIQAYLKDLRGDALLRSIEDTAFEFARSVLLKGDETRFHSHLAPKGCLRWKGVHNVTYKPRTRSRKCDFCDETGGHLPNCETLMPPNVVNIFKKVGEA